MTGQLPPTVLVIEDDLEVLSLIRAHLAGAGYPVATNRAVLSFTALCLAPS